MPKIAYEEWRPQSKALVMIQQANDDEGKEDQ